MKIELYKQAESEAQITGWDFSFIEGKIYEAPLPWNYKEIIEKYLTPEMQILDYDTGGGEFLLKLSHPFENTAATEGYKPNVELCKERLLPLGINFKECATPENIPFADNSFDIIINRHGSFSPQEIYRLLKPNGLFITQQVGDENDRELVEMVLPQNEKPFPGMNLKEQRQKFIDSGFEILEEAESFTPIKFFDIYAFIWFAKIIEWEFKNFSVENCYENLLKTEAEINKNGFIEGKAHRYLIVAKKKLRV